MCCPCSYFSGGGRTQSQWLRPPSLPHGDGPHWRGDARGPFVKMGELFKGTLTASALALSTFRETLRAIQMTLKRVNLSQAVKEIEKTFPHRNVWVMLVLRLLIWPMLNISGMEKNDLFLYMYLHICMDLYGNIFSWFHLKHLYFKIHVIWLSIVCLGIMVEIQSSVLY